MMAFFIMLHISDEDIVPLNESGIRIIFCMFVSFFQNDPAEQYARQFQLISMHA